MQEVLVRVLVSLAVKLISESFLGRMIVRSLRSLAQSTVNKVDDGMVNDLAIALGHNDLVVEVK